MAADSFLPEGKEAAPHSTPGSHLSSVYRETEAALLMSRILAITSLEMTPTGPRGQDSCLGAR